MAKIRVARREDSALVFDFISKLAEYEKMTAEVVGSVELIEKMGVWWKESGSNFYYGW